MKQSIPGIESIFSSRILSLFESLPQGSEVILFGSRAKGNYKEGSDIDLCLKGSGLHVDDRFSYLEKYETLNLPWKLDIVIYEKIQEAQLREHIDRVGKILFISD